MTNGWSDSGFASFWVWAKCIGMEGYLEAGGGGITQFKLPKIKNRKVKEHISRNRKGRPSKKR